MGFTEVKKMSRTEKLKQLRCFIRSYSWIRKSLQEFIKVLALAPKEWDSLQEILRKSGPYIND